MNSTTNCAPTGKRTNQLLGFEMAPGNAAVVSNIPEAADLGGVRTSSNVNIGRIDTVDRDAGGVPRVDVGA